MSAKKDYLFDPARNPLFREDYRPNEYRIPTANVRISLDAEQAVVRNFITVEPNPACSQQGGPLVLDGENLRLKSVQIVDNGKLRHLDPAEYIVTADKLVLKHPPSGAFQLEIVTAFSPEKNTQLSGIYTAGDIICSQCEAQGFRRISYFLDKPDNMTVFTVTLSADKEKYPVLLSNGNGDYKNSKDLGDGRHTVTWTDPWPKPSYLFAVVAGDLKVLEDSFTTMSGKKVDLRIFVQEGYEDKIQWAMESIKRSMAWDEKRYGREYDLDCFHIVAVDKFNAGAMENKGLNIFNVKLLVGSPDSSTDDELIDIEAVIGHEYFHNYTGDRVTVRDWFELTLKEGLTVLRDRQFTEDMHSKPIKRIDDATLLKAGQFMEDAGPMAHPIRPDRVEEFDNIYSGTVYEKGSHVLGMLHTMMGETVWRAAHDEYFNRFDSKAVTCDDYIDVMEQVSGIDLTQFRRWYSQSGTPQVSYSGVYDANARTYTLTLSQVTPPTADQTEKHPLHMPIAVGLIGQSGKDIPLRLSTDDASISPVDTKILHLTKETQSFVFTDIDGPVVPSVLRGFSAPVNVITTPSDDELTFRMAHDSDPYNRFEATERLMLKTMRQLVADASAGKALELPQSFIDAYGANVSAALDGDLSFNSRLLQLPAVNILTQALPVIDPDSVVTAYTFIRDQIAQKFGDDFQDIHRQTRAPANEDYQVIPSQVGRREINSLALGYLAKAETTEVAEKIYQHFLQANNMTDRLTALGALTRMQTARESGLADKALEAFYDRYKDNNNVVDKWLSLKAAMPSDDPFAAARALMQHEAYDATNPNKVYALMGGVLGNLSVFHRTDGAGYKFLADIIIDMNAVNGKTAMRLCGRFGQFRRFDAERQELMVGEMRRIMETPNLDVGVKEVLGRALETYKPAPKQPSSGFNAKAA